MRTLLDRQACGEISESQADDIHNSAMQNLELDFLSKMSRRADTVHALVTAKPDVEHVRDIDVPNTEK